MHEMLEIDCVLVSFVLISERHDDKCHSQKKPVQAKTNWLISDATQGDARNATASQQSQYGTTPETPETTTTQSHHLVIVSTPAVWTVTGCQKTLDLKKERCLETRFVSPASLSVGRCRVLVGAACWSVQNRQRSVCFLQLPKQTWIRLTCVSKYGEQNCVSKNNQ